VTNSTFSGDSAVNAGGAIYTNGALTVTNSTFSGNSTPNFGGAIKTNNGTSTTVTGSTFSANSAYSGGAINNPGTLTADNDIFSGNIAIFNGAGIFNIGSIFPGFSIVSASNNLFYNNLDGTTTEDDCKNCTSANSAIGSNPLLAALGSYGGPTQTMLPTPGSPAICAGSATLVPNGVTTDQRGFSRTTTYSTSTSCVDMGAVQTDYTAVAFSSPSYSGTVNHSVSPAPVVTVTENGQNIGGVPITLGYSLSGTPLTGIGPVTTVGGVGATFGNLTASAAAQGTVSVNLPITASTNTVQPAALTASASLNIQLPVLTITASSATVIYGSPAPAITPSYTGFVNRDGVANLTAQATCTTTYTATSAAGSSPSTSCSGASSPNYAFLYVNGSVTVNQATATINVTPYSVTYNGSAHTAAGAAIGVGGANLAADLTLTGTTHTNAGAYASDAWSFTDPAGNYSSASGTVSDTIGKTAATINVTPYSVTYNGSAHTATGTATGVGGANLAADLTLTGTTHTNAGSYASDAWNFTDPAGNYTSASGTVSDTIGQAAASINVTPYGVTYTGGAHTATATATGAGGANLAADLSLSGTTHTNAGSYASDAWSFTDPAGNYTSAGGTVSDTIAQAPVLVAASSPTVTYGSAAPTIAPIFGGFVNGETSAVLTAQPACITAYTAASAAGSSSSTSCSGAAAANYAFTYFSGSVTVNKATATITVTPYSVTYNGSAHTAASTATGVGGANLAADLTLTGTTHTNAGAYVGDAWSFTDPTGNYAGMSGTVSDTIGQATVQITASSPTVVYGSAVPAVTPIFGASPERANQFRVDHSANLHHNVHDNQRGRIVALDKLLGRGGGQLHI
jgi:hypothetical protein